ncbi:hypothetical protein D3C87_983010 [compost metagenome]
MTPALDPVDLVFAKEKLDALGQPGHAFVFLFHHLEKVERRLDLDAQVGEFRAHGRVVEFGGVQQRLGRHAADVQAGTAQGRASFYASRFQAQLAGANRRVVTAGATAQNHDVISAHGSTPGLGIGRGKSSSRIKLRT